METFWNGEPAECALVRVVVGKSPKATWWCATLEGTEREAVRVEQGSSAPFYLDNEDGSGWQKVTAGRGSPQWGHRSLPVEREAGVDDVAKPSGAEMVDLIREWHAAGLVVDRENVAILLREIDRLRSGAEKLNRLLRAGWSLVGYPESRDQVHVLDGLDRHVAGGADAELAVDAAPEPTP